MRTSIAIDTGLRQPQTFHWTPSNDMFLDNLLDIAWMNIAIPDSFGIDDHHRSVLALVQTTGFIGADLVLQSGLL